MHQALNENKNQTYFLGISGICFLSYELLRLNRKMMKLKNLKVLGFITDVLSQLAFTCSKSKIETLE